MTTTTPHPPLQRIHVWEWPVRLSHWLIAASIVVLAVTGIYIGNPFFSAQGEATRHFIMGTMKAVHFWAAIAFSISVLARVLWMFTGNPYSRWHQLLPVSKQRMQGALRTFAFYVFLRRDPPGYVGHNPLAGFAYALVFLLYLTMIVTGLALVSASAHVESPLRGFSFLAPWLGGLQMARLIHHVSMWLILGFAAHHVWSAFLIAVVERGGLMGSIFSGDKFVPPEVAVRAREHIRTGR
jgi:Ni/Fe-hydrogenase 1 B-type cytochrome subunit